MSDQCPIDEVNRLLFQCALQNRELHQKKTDINQQIRAFRGNIAERKAYICTLRKNIEKLAEDISEKQSTLTVQKELNKRLKISNNLLEQYVQRSKEHLEETKAQYEHNLVHDEERIADCQKKLQEYKDCYYKNPLAQKLLALQAENEEIESQIKACDDQITKAKKELDMLTGPAAASSPEKPSASVSRMWSATDTEEQLAALPAEEDSDCVTDISLHLNLSADGQEMAADENVEENCEGNKVLDLTTDSPVQEEEEFIDQRWTDLMENDVENQETKLADQEPQSAQSDMEEAGEEDIAEKTKKAPPEGDTERPTASPLTLFQETQPQTSPATVKAAPTSPTFPFNFSPVSSPRRGTSSTKSPGFMFSLNSDPSTPGFPGFRLDVGSSQDDDPSFAFTSSFFNEKDTTALKSSSCSEFPFGQAEQNQDFQFAFAAKSPQGTKKENSGDNFPFSFEF